MSVHYKHHPDDKYIDEIRIATRERYKTSGMSGDEWRFSAVLQFYRKGQLLHERAVGNIDSAAALLPWALKTAFEDEGWTHAKDDTLCMQPGCARTAVSEYELVEEFSSQGEKLDSSDYDYPGREKPRRRFCHKHLTRGDCAREDADANYRVVSGPGKHATDWTDARVVESTRVVVVADSPEDVPDAIRDTLRQFGEGETS